MSRPRVLVTDDSVVIRRMLVGVLEAEPALEVVGIASNGKIALRKIEQLKPDILILDVEMPVMDGLETLSELRKRGHYLPVIMFSTLTTRGGVATIEALSRGATDYVAKPANVGSVKEAIDLVRAELVPKILALSGAKRAMTVPPRSAARGRVAVPRGHSIDIVGIGTSTGGPNALAEVIAQLPEDLPVPVVVVQHMPPVFTRILAERLDATCAVSVHEAERGMKVEAGHVYIAPGDFHMTIRGKHRPTIRLTQDGAENSCRPAVDVLFRSLAETYGGSVLGVVMTGMGKDGYVGAEELVAAGSTMVVQDEASSVVWGMPGYVARANLADSVIPLEQIGTDITRRVRRAAKRQQQAVGGGVR